MALLAELAIVIRIALRYSAQVIKEFRHKGLKKFFETGSKAGIQPRHANKLRAQLGLLDVAARASDTDVHGWELHALKGDLAGQWSVWVNGNWRLTFAFEGEDVVLVDYQDYH
jgi:proteic killer suppression protein